MGRMTRCTAGCASLWLLTNAARLPVPCCSAAPKKEAVAASVTAAAAAMLAHPMAAEAAVTPSLSNLLGSLAAGGVVLAGIAVAITAVS